MRFLTAAIAIAALAIVAIGAWYMIDVDQTREARLPNVDVNVEGGQLPDYEVRTGEVEIGTEQQSVTVPEVDVRMTEQEVTVPSINIETPDEAAAEANTEQQTTTQ